MRNRYARMAEMQRSHQEFESEMNARRTASEEEDRRLRDDISGRTAAEQRTQEAARECEERETVLAKQAAFAEGRWQPGQPWPIVEQPTDAPASQSAVSLSEEQRIQIAVRDASLAFMAHSDYHRSVRNFELLTTFIDENGLDATQKSSFHTAYAALKDKMDSPRVTVTEIRPADELPPGSERAPDGTVFSSEAIAEMSAEEYKRRFRLAAGHRIDRYGVDHNLCLQDYRRD